MSNSPKRHHHLAQALQRNFLQKGEEKLWWYSRETNTYEERTPRAIAHAKHTYTFSAVQGEERYALEHAFSKVEDKAVTALRKLEREEEITPSEKNAISELVGFQYLRTPSKIALIQQVRDLGGGWIVQEYAQHLDSMTTEQFSVHVANYKAKTGKTLDLSQEELVESLKNRPPKVTSTKEATLESLVDLGTTLAIEYSRRSWVVMHAPADSSFITSSEGIYSSGERSERGTSPGPGVPGVVTVFPFARRAALLIEGSGPSTLRHARVHKKAVREINDELATVSGEIYGSPRQLLESIVKRNDLATTRYELVPDSEYLAARLTQRLRDHPEDAFPE